MTHKFIFRVHAFRRMFERSIPVDEVAFVVRMAEAVEADPNLLEKPEFLHLAGSAPEVIESYPNDKPYPSRLLLGWPEGASSPRCRS